VKEKDNLIEKQEMNEKRKAAAKKGREGIERK
jgi:hypothetical protein